ncbi:ParB N-terminal domain-containing protein [Kitasatospora aureofaciens]|uniref:ParB N-terminal domain-containing protein n=1 Tax=Kitasatospora aureofaciens TaxID=1894 RepID=UPI0033C73FDB
MIELSEVLGYQSADAGCYRRCEQCGEVVRSRTHCGRIASGIVTTVREVLSLKRRDPEYDDLVDSIRHHGIGTPILIYGRTVHNGGHRIAAAEDLGIPEVPWCNDSSIGWEDDWPDDSVLDCSS